MRLNLKILWPLLAAFHPVGPAPAGLASAEGVRLSADTAETDALIRVTRGVEGVLCRCGGESIRLDTDDLVGVFNCLLEAFERFNGWERAALAALSTHEPLGTLLEIGCSLFPNPALISDASHDAIAVHFSDSPDNPEYRRFDRRHAEMTPAMLASINRALASEAENRHAYSNRADVFPLPAVVKNLFSKDRLIGWLVILAVEDADRPLLLFLAEHLGGYIERWVALSDEQGKLASQSDLFLDILYGRQADDQRLTLRLQGIGWQPEDKKLAISIAGEAGAELVYPMLQRVLPQAFSGCYAVQYNDALMLFANLSIYDEDELYDTLGGVLKGCGVCCGVSYPFTDIAKLKSFCRQAEIAAQYGPKQPGAIHRCEDYALMYIRDVLRDHLDADIRHPALRRLKDYDAENQTEYYWTLLVYLLNERELTATARALCIHRNSVVYRVGRIRELCGLPLDELQTRLHLLASFFVENGLLPAGTAAADAT